MGEKPQKIQEQKQISLGVLAHVDAGKTTLSEGLLFKCGRIRKIGRVDHKDAYLDTYELERERGITIFSKQAVFSMGAFNVTLLDTPGHVDFSAEMERTLQVLDYAILVINGADGVQGHTQTLWRLLEQYKIPTFLFVNKMDQDGTDREGLLQELKKKLSGNCVDFGGKLPVSLKMNPEWKSRWIMMDVLQTAKKATISTEPMIFWKISPYVMKIFWKTFLKQGLSKRKLW